MQVVFTPVTSRGAQFIIIHAEGGGGGGFLCEKDDDALGAAGQGWLVGEAPLGLQMQPKTAANRLPTFQLHFVCARTENRAARGAKIDLGAHNALFVEPSNSRCVVPENFISTAFADCSIQYLTTFSRFVCGMGNNRVSC